jgi:SAM-dependent methyltransferase
MDIAANREIWERKETWASKGEDWSRPWGSVSAQWYGTILPRIAINLPADTILEIACGFGRWTDFLRTQCRRLIVVDLSQLCVEHCRKRFAQFDNIQYWLNDGESLAMVPDSSIDFAFSFDSLVHADKKVMNAYISQFARILKRGAKAFVQHSNLGEYLRQFPPLGVTPTLPALFRGVGWIARDYYWRDPQVSAELVRKLAEQHNIRCSTQELVGWKTRWIQFDCFSTFVNDWDPVVKCPPTFVLRNGRFMEEVSAANRVSKLYLTPR